MHVNQEIQNVVVSVEQFAKQNKVITLTAGTLRAVSVGQQSVSGLGFCQQIPVSATQVV